MPTRRYTARDLETSTLAMMLALHEMDGRARKRARFGPDAARDDFWELAFLALAAEPFMRTRRSSIGPERLSIARLEQEAAAAGSGGHGTVDDVYARFGVRLSDLRRFVDALRMPAGMRLRGGHIMRGEEAVLITLRRFKHAGATALHTPAAFPSPPVPPSSSSSFTLQVARRRSLGSWAGARPLLAPRIPR